MTVASQFAPRYTVEDYALWQGDWELWDGIAIAMSPSPFGIHQGIVFTFARLLGNAIESAGCQANVVGELDWIIGQDTVVRPDLVVICGDLPKKHLHQPPELVVEVLSKSTRLNDLGYKRQLYEMQGVRTYLIVDPDSKTVEKLSISNDGQYAEHGSLEKLTLRVCEDCELELSTQSIFGG